MAARGYRRILLKLSGEALMGELAHGIEPGVLNRVAAEIAKLHASGVQLGVVIGGGNLYRGAVLAQAGIDRVTGDYMGMLATVMNALAMGDALQRHGVEARVLSAIAMTPVAETYSPYRARDELAAGRVVLLSAGTGNPYFTTDTGAALRAVEIQAEVMVKATKVDGVYSADPETNPRAVKYDRLSYDEVLARQLAVMDLAALVLCRDHRMPLRVINMTRPGEMRRAVLGERVGTVIHR